MLGLHPGVYIEEVPSGARPVDGASTSIAAFVGPAARGRPGVPVLLHGWSDYVREFGPVSADDDAMGLALSAYYLNGGRDAYVVRLVGQGGGGAQVAHTPVKTGGTLLFQVRARSPGTWGDGVRVMLVPGSAARRWTLKVGHWDGESFVVDESFRDLDLLPASDRYLPRVVGDASGLVEIALADAASPGATGCLYAPATLTGAALAASTDLKALLSGKSGVLTLNLSEGGFQKVTIPADRFKTLAGDQAADGPVVAKALEDAVRAAAQRAANTGFSASFKGGRFALASGGDAWTTSIAARASDGVDAATTVDLLDALSLKAGTVQPCDAAVQPDPVTGALVGGKPAGQALVDGQDQPPQATDYQACFDDVLRKIADISILVLPGVTTGDGDIVGHAVAHCEDEAVRNRMLILDPPANAAFRSAADYTGLGVTTSSYAVLYYPSIRIDNPLYDPRTRPDSAPTLTIGPAASVAGVWARTDGRRGVWKAPAGVETALLGVAALTQDVGDGEQDQLNPLGVNCLRRMPGFGPVVWGSRTLSTKAEPEWRYVPVRRTAIMIEQSIRNSIQWAVFEPNDQRLWAALRVNIESFMNGLWRAGAFQGEKAADAYFVRCRLGDTMTQGDIDAGRVIVDVGFAPLKPAEFVIVRIQQKVAQQ